MADLASGLQHYPAVGDLVVLVAVAEQRGVSAAARVLGIPQPNASRALRRLEGQLGLTLVERTPRGSALTADGAVVVDWARQVVEDYEQLASGAARSDTPTGRSSGSRPARRSPRDSSPAGWPRCAPRIRMHRWH